MKKLITVLCCSLIGSSAFAQWTPTTLKRNSKTEASQIHNYYKLDLNKMRDQLKNAQETGANAKPVEISLPTLSGKVEKFAVYSFPVVVKELADQYQLGSYVGVGIDDPTKYVRFSVSPSEFQSMMIKDGVYEFIDPQTADKTLYSVHPKTINTAGKSFICSTSEDPIAINQVEKMLKGGQSFTNQPTDFSKSSDKKYRTMRLAISATGEYTAFHGGTVASALSAINATMTRVNGVFEKDFALHLNIQNYPGIIYLNAATDPYNGNLNVQLQQTLTANVGNDNYDIGHVFNAAGNNGNAGCIGCVCVNPATSTSTAKGSAFTQSTNPIGDTFDIDFVAHEMGHQLGGNHTFSHALEGSGVNVEPGSGTTIMGYAGITGPNTDVQPNSDPFFHKVSIVQVQNNLISKTCDVETTTTNNPPVIAPLPTYNIPKGTAFVLTASATDPENDPITYMWEQTDNATVTINKFNLGTTTTGPSFRSFTPTTNPTRYFPKLSSVLNGVLDNSNNDWESVSKVARNMKFSVTVRDNNTNPTQQQTQFAEQTIIVGNNGPFKVNTQYANISVPTPVEWDVAGTTAAPYNVANVKIDYTSDNGANWTVLSASTVNDGSENFNFPASLNGQTIKLRVSALGNVFYAVGSVLVTQFSACTGAAPTGIAVNNITFTGATVNWAPILNATYIIRYRVIGQATWQQTTSTSSTVTLTGLVDTTNYEVQVAAVCSGTTGAYSASVNFSTTPVVYCTSGSSNGNFNYISNVTLATVNNTTAGTTYSDFTATPALQPTLLAGSLNTISVSLTTTIAGASVNGMAVWIDYNKNGVFESNERVLNMPIAALPVGATPVTGSFTVPLTAVTNSPLRMRAVTVLMNSSGVGSNIPDSFACGSFPYGEVEDYNVIISAPLATNETANGANNGIQIYPNPVTDILNVTKVSDKATYKIYSAAGQLVGNGNVNAGKINVSALLKGAYVITIEEKGRDSFNSKFVKK